MFNFHPVVYHSKWQNSQWWQQKKVIFVTKLTADFDKLDKNLSNLSDGALILVTKTSMICLHQLHHHLHTRWESWGQRGNSSGKNYWYWGLITWFLINPKDLSNLSNIQIGKNIRYCSVVYLSCSHYCTCTLVDRLATISNDSY